MTSSKRPVLLERDLVEKAQRGDGDEDGTGRQLLFVGQVHLVGADVLRAQLFRRFVEVAREQGNLLHVGRLRVQGEIPHLHVFGHALPKGCHEETPLRNGMCCKQPIHAFAKEVSRRPGTSPAITDAEPLLLRSRATEYRVAV